MPLSKNSLYTVCGITTDAEGNTKVRWTQDLIRRTKLFIKQGHTRVDLVELPGPMSKLEALAFIKAHERFADSGDQMIIDDAVSYRELVKSKAEGTYVARPRGRPRKNPVAEVKVKTTVKRSKKNELSMEAIKARIADDSEVADVLEAAGIAV